MRHEVIVHPRTALLSRLPDDWQMPFMRLVTAWVVLLLLFLPTWAEMAHQWWNISTYNHILLVPAIIAWLVSLRLRELTLLEPQAWWFGLVPMSAFLLAWLLGDSAGLNIVAQGAVVGMLASSVILLLGPRVFAALLFPMAFLFFLVPFGDEIIPALQQVTAKLCVALIHMSGVPATIDGIYIDTPAGLFRVAEACSGVKFLIAMTALSTLVAHLGFRSWPKRIVFMVFATALSVIGNGVRAWGTVYIAQYQGMEFAAGFDHIVYGWVFFAVLMTAALGAGWRFFDRPADDVFIDAAGLNDSTFMAILDRFSGRGWHVLCVFGLIVLTVVGWSSAARTLDQPAPLRIDFQDAQGWGNPAGDTSQTLRDENASPNAKDVGGFSAQMDPAAQTS